LEKPWPGEPLSSLIFPGHPGYEAGVRSHQAEAFVMATRRKKIEREDMNERDCDKRRHDDLILILG
jgi:hypothetical protein